MRAHRLPGALVLGEQGLEQLRLADAVLLEVDDLRLYELLVLRHHAECAHEVVVHLLALVVRGGAELGVLLLQRGDLPVALGDGTAPVGATLQDVPLQILGLLVALLQLAAQLLAQELLLLLEPLE